jgi:hypothetical protein
MQSDNPVCESCGCKNNLEADPRPSEQWRGHCSDCVKGMMNADWILADAMQNSHIKDEFFFPPRD